MDGNQKLIDLLKQYSELQAANAKINAKIFAKEGKEKIQGKVEQAKDAIVSQARTYGQKAKDIESKYSLNKEEKGSIMEQYRSALTDINNQYKYLLHDLIFDQQQYQIEEQELIVEQKNKQNERKKEAQKSPEYKAFQVRKQKLIKEAQEAIENGFFDTLNAKTKELQELNKSNPLNKYDKELEEIKTKRKEVKQLLEKCEEAIEKCNTDRNNAIDEATEEKDTELAKIKKQNVIQKMLGSIFNKMNGAKKFKNAVIGKMNTKIQKIKNEDLPKVKKSVQEKYTSFSEKVNNIKGNIKDKAIGALGKGKDTISNIINNARAVKANIRNKLANSLSNSIEKAKSKNEKLNSKLNPEEEQEL